MFDLKNASKLGFGCMRFEGQPDGKADIDAVKQMIDAFIAAGGNYFDTAWAYPHSEETLGKALVGRYPRDSYCIASKCVAWVHCDGPEDLERQLQESLEALGTDYIDVYLMHNLGVTREQSFAEHGAWEFMKSAKERGLVHHIGFSAHCQPEDLERYINLYPEAEIVQIQVNYGDWDDPSYRERECVQVANAHGKPIVVMEPVKGGLLADPPAAVKRVLDEEMPGVSYAEAALRFAASADGVLTVLSGMTTLEMVQENCKVLSDFEPLSAREQEAMAHAREALAESGIVPCTGCGYCAKVCPVGVGISESLTGLNYYINYGDAAEAQSQLGLAVAFNAGKKMPTDCKRCSACEDACPQGIPILECFDRIIEEILPVKVEHPKLMKM